jgi:hypothetical protein
MSLFCRCGDSKQLNKLECKECARNTKQKPQKPQKPKTQKPQKLIKDDAICKCGGDKRKDTSCCSTCQCRFCNKPATKDGVCHYHLCTNCGTHSQPIDSAYPVCSYCICKYPGCTNRQARNQKACYSHICGLCNDSSKKQGVLAMGGALHYPQTKAQKLLAETHQTCPSRFTKCTIPSELEHTDNCKQNGHSLLNECAKRNKCYMWNCARVRTVNFDTCSEHTETYACANRKCVTTFQQSVHIHKRGTLCNTCTDIQAMICFDCGVMYKSSSVLNPSVSESAESLSQQRLCTICANQYWLKQRERDESYRLEIVNVAGTYYINHPQNSHDELIIYARAFKKGLRALRPRPRPRPLCRSPEGTILRSSEPSGLCDSKPKELDEIVELITNVATLLPLDIVKMIAKFTTQPPYYIKLETLPFNVSRPTTILEYGKYVPRPPGFKCNTSIKMNQ